MKKEEFKKGLEDYYFEKYKDTAGLTKVQLEEKTGLKFKGKDWNYTKSFNILTYEDCLNYENEQEIKAHIERKMEELKNTYIDCLRTALNEL